MMPGEFMLPDEIADSLNHLRSNDAGQQNLAYTALMAATNMPVVWAYEIWDGLLTLLRTGDNRQRAIASQVVCNLAKSDPRQRMLEDLSILLEVTKDERFVTARHCMQSLWKVGIAGEEQRRLLLSGLSQRFKECITEKNGTLIRYDILESMRHIYDSTHDEEIPMLTAGLMELEEDPKYKKKYATLWRKKA
jgi:hypothetical protein